MKNKLTEKFKSLYKAPVLESDARLWGIFLIARFALALILLLIQILLYYLQEPIFVTEYSWLQLPILTVYLFEAVLIFGLVYKTKLLYNHRLLLWISTLGLDMLIFCWMYWSNYDVNSLFWLFIFSALMAGTLGPRWLIYVVCGVISALVAFKAGALTSEFYHSPWQIRGMVSQLFACGGILIVGELTRQLAVRLRREEHRAHAGVYSAKQQEGLNRLIVSEMAMGVIVGDSQAQLKMINPAAIALITGDEESTLAESPTDILKGLLGWDQLQGVMKILFESGISNRWLIFDFLLDQGERGPSMLQIKGRLLSDEDAEEGSVSEQGLCVLFLTDLRDVDRRMQQEKLAAMGRVSASIAHEIRNPLATITSANMLLSEGLTDRASLRLSEMIATNSNRLSQIVKDVLEVAHLEVHGEVEAIDLLYVLPDMVKEWANMNQLGKRIYTYWPDDIFGVFISFDIEHLRRVIINLLGNASRYASYDSGAIYVTLKVFKRGASEKVRVSVFSDGEMLDSKIEHSLFEPFFSTESRGTGLGLYICRDLCNRYDADLEFRRSTVEIAGIEKNYNEFYITANRVDPLPGETQIMIEQVKSPSEEH